MVSVNRKDKRTEVNKEDNRKVHALNSALLKSRWRVRIILVKTGHSNINRNCNGTLMSMPYLQRECVLAGIRSGSTRRNLSDANVLTQGANGSVLLRSLYTLNSKVNRKTPETSLAVTHLMTFSQVCKVKPAPSRRNLNKFNAMENYLS